MWHATRMVESDNPHSGLEPCDWLNLGREPAADRVWLDANGVRGCRFNGDPVTDPGGWLAWGRNALVVSGPWCSPDPPTVYLF